jgi:hypothetical protein
MITDEYDWMIEELGLSNKDELINFALRFLNKNYGW